MRTVQDSLIDATNKKAVEKHLHVSAICSKNP